MPPRNINAAPNSNEYPNGIKPRDVARLLQRERDNLREIIERYIAETSRKPGDALYLLDQFDTLISEVDRSEGVIGFQKLTEQVVDISHKYYPAVNKLNEEIARENTPNRYGITEMA